MLTHPMYMHYMSPITLHIQQVIPYLNSLFVVHLASVVVEYLDFLDYLNSKHEDIDVLDYLNSKHEDIDFTMECEKGKTLYFVDVKWISPRKLLKPVYRATRELFQFYGKKLRKLDALWIEFLKWPDFNSDLEELISILQYIISEQYM